MMGENPKTVDGKTEVDGKDQIEQSKRDKEVKEFIKQLRKQKTVQFTSLHWKEV